MNRVREISIIGPGKVGTALGVLCARAGWNVIAVGGGRPGSAPAAAAAIGSATRACSAAEAAGAAAVVLLTVPDDRIATVCHELAAAGAFHAGAVVAHCCGAMGSDVLAEARACGADVGSFHPLQTFPTVEAAVARLPGSSCFIEGDDRAWAALASLAAAIGATAMRIRPEAKALYHAAAATACNFLVTLLDCAATMLAQALGDDAPANRDQALAALGPLVEATLSNVLQLGPERALTGPIARGDVETVRRHLAAVGQQDAQLAALYRTLGALTVDLAARKGSLSAEVAERLKTVILAGTGQGRAADQANTAHSASQDLPSER